MNRSFIQIIIIVTLTFMADFSMALSIECHAPRIIERDFPVEEVQWFRSESKTDGEFSEGHVIDGILPLIKEGLPFSRLLVDIESGKARYSFELSTEKVEGEGIGFAYEQSIKPNVFPIFRAFYKSHEICPKSIYVFTATFSSK